MVNLPAPFLDECDCECDCLVTLYDSEELFDGRCFDCQEGYHNEADHYSDILENSGWGSWDDGGLR